jgi:hypothetical protein
MNPTLSTTNNHANINPTDKTMSKRILKETSSIKTCQSNAPEANIPQTGGHCERYCGKDISLAVRIGDPEPRELPHIFFKE